MEDTDEQLLLKELYNATCVILSERDELYNALRSLWVETARHTHISMHLQRECMEAAQVLDKLREKYDE